jgi:hypothetical protein
MHALNDPLNVKTVTVRNSLTRSPLRRGFLFSALALALAWLPLPRTALAADGGLPNGNTAEGDFSLDSLTSGSFNSAIGYAALFSNTSGDNNTASGSFALYSNTNGPSPLKGDFNTATGSNALFSNTIGNGNTATGVNALLTNTNAYYNTATGFQALYSNTGFFNTATGANALFSNQRAGYNTANGFAALYTNINGLRNTATGYEALYTNGAGNDNTASGYFALYNNTGNNNVAIGSNAGLNLTTGNNNVAIGSNAGRSLGSGSSNNIDIGFNVVGVAGESNTMRIGNLDITSTYIRGISGQTAPGGAAVFVNPNGKLGTMTSSARFKDEIKPMDKASEVILALRPVSFRYKKGIDAQGIPQFGLIAEEVEKVEPKLVARDENGKINTVRYEAVNAMLLNEFLKEHRKVQELEKQIEALTTGLQKVNDQLELTKTARHLIANDQ